MLRVSLKNVSRSSVLLPSATNGRIVCARNQSTSSKGSGIGKVVFGITGLAAAATIGGLAYAKYDSSFRNKLQETIPDSKWILDAILDDKSVSPAKKPDETFTFPKRKTNLEANSSKTSAKQTESAPTSSSSSSPSSSSSTSSQSSTGKESTSKVNNEVELTRKNIRFTEELKKTIEQLEKEIKEAITAEAAASEKSKEYSQTLTAILDTIDEDDSNAWKNLSQLKEQREQAISKANKKLNQTRMLIDKIQTNVKQAKADKQITSAASISGAEEVIIRCLFQLDNSEKSLNSAQTAFNISENYQNVFNTAIEELEKEIKAITSDGKLKKKLTEDELKILVTHSHKKIKQLYKKLAKLEATEKLRIDEAVHLQKEEDYRLIDTKIALELAKRKSELEMDYQKKASNVKEDLESELRAQLKRQLAAYQDHLREQLDIQRMELERRNSLLFEENLVEEKGKYCTQLQASLSRLTEIEKILKNREQLDKEERKARELWIFSQKLIEMLKLRNGSVESGPKNLTKEIAQMKQTATSMEMKNDLTMKVLDSLPKTVITDGVFTEDDLIDRFKKLEKLCKRVALIDDEGGSLFKYLLSYIQASMLFERQRVFTEEINGVEKWDTFDIIARVNDSLSKRDLENSLRYANQLKGKSRQVASDWIKDLRTHLELKQSVEILQAQAAALTLRALR